MLLGCLQDPHKYVQDAYKHFEQKVPKPSHHDRASSADIVVVGDPKSIILARTIGLHLAASFSQLQVFQPDPRVMHNLSPEKIAALAWQAKLACVVVLTENCLEDLGVVMEPPSTNQHPEPEKHMGARAASLVYVSSRTFGPL